MEWVASTRTLPRNVGVSSIANADAHTSAASIRLNRRPRRFKWTRPFRRKTKSGFCACAITFQTQSTLNKSQVSEQGWCFLGYNYSSFSIFYSCRFIKTRWFHQVFRSSLFFSSSAVRSCRVTKVVVLRGCCRLLPLRGLSTEHASSADISSKHHACLAGRMHDLLTYSMEQSPS
jgi:hypothetical protein